VLPKIRERTISRKHNMGEISNMLRVIQWVFKPDLQDACGDTVEEDSHLLDRYLEWPF
jgi:hypothetical protein